MPFLNSVVNWVSIKRIYQVDLFKKYPLEVQRECLLNLLKKAKDTEWGKKFDYQSIKTIDQFREQIPLQTYDEIKPFVERLRKGESNLLWPGEIKWFAKSSGTTNDKSKFIPVSKDSLENCHFRGFRDVLAFYNRNYPETKVLKGKTLTLGGSHSANNLQNNSYCGDLSAIMIENIPFWTEFRRTPSTEVALIHEFEEKIERIIEQSINENVTAIAGVPSWYLVLLRRVLKATGKSNILEVWPNLEVFIHGGIKFDPYREQYRELFPSPKMHYMEAYNASEGFFGIQDEPDKDDMLLMLDYGIFYEFIPMDQFDTIHSKTITLEEVEVGKNYALVISTNGGLWRYLIGDTVMFTSRTPYRIKITGRTKHFINAFGEELIIDNAENALSIATERTGAIISEYTAGPIFMKGNQKGVHQWIIEFEKEPDDIEHFTSILDDSLKTLNSDYEAKRHKNSTLEMPKVVVAPRGTFYTWMKQRNKLGGQNKIPRLANDRKYLDPLLDIIAGM